MQGAMRHPTEHSHSGETALKPDHECNYSNTSARTESQIATFISIREFRQELKPTFLPPEDQGVPRASPQSRCWPRTAGLGRDNVGAHQAGGGGRCLGSPCSFPQTWSSAAQAQHVCTPSWPSPFPVLIWRPQAAPKTVWAWELSEASAQSLPRLPAPGAGVSPAARSGQPALRGPRGQGAKHA